MSWALFPLILVFTVQETVGGGTEPPNPQPELLAFAGPLAHAQPTGRPFVKSSSLSIVEPGLMWFPSVWGLVISASP